MFGESKVADKYQFPDKYGSGLTQIWKVDKYIFSISIYHCMKILGIVKCFQFSNIINTDQYLKL